MLPDCASASAPPGGARRGSTALILMGIVLAALALRVWALVARRVIDFDETYYYILGRNLVTGAGYTLNGLPHTAFPPLYPLLVGIVSLFTADVRLSTSLVSAVAGALLVIPVYFLAKDIHGRQAGLLAASAAAVWGGLFFFAASNVRYADRLYFGSEPLYVTLVASAMLFTWRFARAGGYPNAILAGGFAGLAALVRNEGPVVFAFLFLWLVIDKGLTRSLWRKRALPQTVLVAAVMLAVMSPFLIYVHNVTGRWTLGAKLTNNARIRNTLWTWVHNNNNADFMLVHYQLNSDNTQMEDPYWGVSDWHRNEARKQGALASGLGLIAKPDWKWLSVFTDIFWNVPKPLVPRYAWAIIIISLAVPPWNGARLRWWLFCLFNFLPMALLAVSLYALPRHELPLLVIFAVAFARGLSAVTDFVRWAARSVRLGRISAGAVSLVPTAAVLAVMCASGVNLNRAGDVRGRDLSFLAQPHDAKLAAMLAAKLPPGSTLMCNAPWIALWSGMDWRVSPMAAPARLVEYARAKHIDFAALPTWRSQLDPSGAAVLTPYAMTDIRVNDDLVVYDLRRLWQETPRVAPAAPVSP